MIYSKDDVLRMLATIKGLPQFDVQEGGCGDPECCGSYVEETVGSDYVKTYDLAKAIKEIEDKL